MRLTNLVSKTRKTTDINPESINFDFLTRGGFVKMEMAGVYSFLPLGLRVLKKVEQIVREEMDKFGGQEILMPVLHPRDNWDKTGRWKGFDVLFKLQSQAGKDFALGPSHEEIVVPLVRDYVQSYRDYPVALYQIQVKFRDELRAKNGLLRGREFLMKDLYSFHATEDDFWNYYEDIKSVYTRIFERMGLKTVLDEAGGGTFSKISHEYSVLNEAGEDTIYLCDKCDLAQNKEIVTYKEGDKCPKCKKGTVYTKRGIEVGNIFPLSTKFSDAFDLKYLDQNGKRKPVVMGCYGIGISRAMGTIVEEHYDEKGIIWPESVAPYQVHLVALGEKGSKEAEKLYKELSDKGVEVLFDDRDDAAGAKFADADLIGCPVRLTVSDKTVAAHKVEYKKRDHDKAGLLTKTELLKKLA